VFERALGQNPDGLTNATAHQHNPFSIKIDEKQNEKSRKQRFSAAC